MTGRIVHSLGHFLPARHFKGTPIPGRWLRGNHTAHSCAECGAAAGMPCTYKARGSGVQHEVQGFVHTTREDDGALEQHSIH
jgi:hypothetical protein